MIEKAALALYASMTGVFPAPWSIERHPRRNGWDGNIWKSIKDAEGDEIATEETHTGDGTQLYLTDAQIESLVEFINTVHRSASGHGPYSQEELEKAGKEWREGFKQNFSDEIREGERIFGNLICPWCHQYGHECDKGCGKLRTYLNEVKGFQYSAEIVAAVKTPVTDLL